MMTTDIKSMSRAGTDLMIGSLTFMCETTAPSIKIVIPEAAATASGSRPGGSLSSQFSLALAVGVAAIAVVAVVTRGLRAGRS